ncbi:hypothetical protein Peur_051593 [Populus x canadensis]
MNIHAHKQVFIHVLVNNDNVDNEVKYFQAEEDYMVIGSRADVGNEIRKLHVLGSGITGLTKSRRNTISMLYNAGGVRLTTFDEIKKELVDFYSNLFGKEDANVTGVSIEKLQYCSWNWGKLLKLRSVAWVLNLLIEVVIGNGKNTHLLWDCWLSNGPLIKTHGSRIAMKSGLSADAEVADVIRHSAWCWPNAMPEDMEEVQCAYSLIVPSEAEDQFIWKLTPDVIDLEKATLELQKLEEDIKDTVNRLQTTEGLILSKEKEAAMTRFQRLLLIAGAATAERFAALEPGDIEETNLLLAEAEAANEAKKTSTCMHF